MFEEALAELSGMKLSRVVGLVHDRSSTAFRAIYSKAGLPASAFPAFREAIATLNEDGSRRWIRPKPSAGKWLIRRRAVAYGLIAAFLLIPHLRMGGKPWMLLDLPRREFTLFGTTFLPTDTLLLMLLGVSLLVGIFLLQGAKWARITAIVLVAINALGQLSLISVQPWLSLALLAVDIIVIFALTVHGREIDAKRV